MKSSNLQPGDVVRVAGHGRCTVIEADDGLVVVETNGPAGGLTCARFEVSKCRDQRPVPLLARFWAPYLTWRCQDGTEILANRNYRPTMIRRPGRPAVIANGDEEVPYVESWWHFDDLTPPWASKRAMACTVALLADWGFPGWRGEGLTAIHKKPSSEDLVVPAWAEAMWAALRDQQKREGRSCRTYHHFEER